MIKILLVESQMRIRQGLKMRLALETDVMIIGETSDCQEAIQLAQELQPDVIVMEVEMAVLDCFSTIRSLHQQTPDIKIIALSLYDDETTRHMAQLAGATAFTAKSSGPTALLGAIHKTVEQPVD